METTLLVLGDDNKWIQLDLYSELPINVIIQETDITDITARRSAYSKTFQIPGTKINNDFFEHFYNVSGIGYDPLTRRFCVVQYRGTDIFRGFLRLNAVITIQDKIEYEVFILSELTDFSSIITDKTLRDLDWSYLNHTQNYETVFNSWYANSGDEDGLFGGKVLYPMIHYGLDYPTATGDTPLFRYAINDSLGIDNISSPIQPTYFKPAVRVKEIIDLIFRGSGYNIVSDFFNSDYFKSIYMDTAMNGLLGVNTAEENTNQNIFKVYGDPPPNNQIFLRSNGLVQQINMGRISTTDGYDPSLNFNEPFSAYQIPYPGEYSFEFKAKVSQRTNINTVPTFYGISIAKSNTLEGLSNPATRTLVGGTVDNLTAFNDVSGNNRRIFINNIELEAGVFVGIFLRFNQSGSNYTAPGLVVKQRDGDRFGAVWELYDSPKVISSNFVDMKLQFPELPCIEFIRAIIKMFNLVVVQTENDREFRIEPYTWYYSQATSRVVDWTDKIDLNSPIKIEPVNFQLNKEVNFQYTSGQEEYLNKLWEGQYQIPYGTKRFTATSDILAGTQTIELPFRPIPTDVIENSTNIIIPKYYREDEGTGKQVPYSDKNHIFFWVGNRFFYEDDEKTIPKTWYMLDGAIPTSQTTYPCVSHLSSLDVEDSDNLSDLNFDKNFDFFGNSNTEIIQFTDYNLYQTWYGDYFNNLYSPEVRRLTARILLDPIEVSQIKLTDRVFIKDSLFNIERINEADLVNRKLTEVSLIKSVSPYNKIIPPAPDHSIQPNQSYPT